MVEIYTDGSALDNGSENCSGGWGVCALVPDEKSEAGVRIDKMLWGRDGYTTNNKMELIALLTALKLAQTDYIQEQCIIKSDSAYCVNMFNEWIYSWQKRGWVRPKNQEIKNLDLVKKIWNYCTIDYPNFRVEKVKGHSTVLGNNIADCLATNSLTKLAKILEENHIENPILEKIDSQ